MVFASRSKRVLSCAFSANSAGSTLMATDRSSRVSRAFHTSPIPPAPRGARTSYGPRRVPAVIAMKCVGILLAAVDPPHPGRVSFAQWLSNLARGLHLLGVALSEENGCSWIAGEKSAGQGIQHRLRMIGEPHPHLLYCMFHPGDEFRVSEPGDAAAKVSFRKLRRGVVLAEEEAVHEGREEGHAEV